MQFYKVCSKWLTKWSTTLLPVSNGRRSSTGRKLPKLSPTSLVVSASLPPFLL